MSQHPDRTEVNFSADGRDPKRVRLYHHIARHFDKDYEHKDESGEPGGYPPMTSFTVHRR